MAKKVYVLTQRDRDRAARQVRNGEGLVRPARTRAEVLGESGPNLNFVQVTSATGSGGPGGNTYYPGHWYTFDPTTGVSTQQSADVWVHDLNGGGLDTDTFYPADQRGDAGDGKLVWLVGFPPDATPTNRGLVNTTSQQFAGEKKFQDLIHADAGVELLPAPGGSPTGFFQYVSGLGPALNSDAGASDHTAVYVDHAATRVVAATFNTATNPKFSVRNAQTATQRDGVWGSLTDGSVVSGGLVTTIGTGGGGTVTSVDVTPPPKGITASGGPITTSGSITLALANDLAAVEGLSGTGLAVRTATDTWTTRQIKDDGGTTTTVTNPDGVTGNPMVAVSATYAGQTSITTLGTVSTGTWQGTPVANAYLADSSLTVTAGTGLSGGGSVSLGGTVTLTLDLTHANTWTAAQTVEKDALGVTSTDGVVLKNATAAAAGAQQISPRVRFVGQGWKTNATAASQTVEFIEELLPVQGAGAPTGQLQWSAQVNGGGYAVVMTLDSGGNLVANTLAGNGVGITNLQANQLNGTVDVQHGGTGQFSLTAHGILLGNATSAVSVTAAMTDGQLLVGQSSSDPLPKTVTGDVTISAAGATAIGSGRVTNAMLAGSIAASKLVGTDIATVGTITSGTWTGTTIAVANGGTGQTSYTDGQLLIGNTTGNTLTKATLTAPAAGVTVTNGHGSITFALANDLSAVEGLSTNGLAARTATDTWTTRTLTGTAGQVTVTNGDGVSGNPTVSLPATITQAEAVTVTDSATSTTTAVLTLGHDSSGTPAAGFGLLQKFQLQTSTTADTDAANFTVTWATATHASRKARAVLNVYDTSAREVLRGEASGSAPMIGFLGASASAAQTGDAGTALVTFGLMTGTPTFAFANCTGTVALATQVSGVLPFANVALTTDVYAWRVTSDQSLTQNAWTTVIFNIESKDGNSEYDPTTGTFTPAVTGTYLVNVSCSFGGSTGRNILAIWTGTSSELQRVMDATGAVLSGTALIDLTASTGYTFRAFPTNSGVVANLGQALTFLRIRRVS